MIRSPVFLAQPDAGFSPLSFADSLEQPARVQVLTPGPGFSISTYVSSSFASMGLRLVPAAHPWLTPWAALFALRAYKARQETSPTLILIFRTTI